MTPIYSWDVLQALERHHALLGNWQLGQQHGHAGVPCRQGVSLMGMLSLKRWHASAGLPFLLVALLLVVRVHRQLIGRFWRGIIAFASSMATLPAALLNVG